MMPSLLSNENNPVVPTSAKATPLLLLGVFNQPCTVAVMSIKMNVFALGPETVTGCPPVADVPSGGGGVLYFSVLSDHAGVAGKL
jgi:hypothetical protein